MKRMEQCSWCLEDSRETVVVKGATIDCSYIDICPKCIGEVLAEEPGASVVESEDDDS